MKKFLFLILTVAAVVAALAGGTAFLIRYNQIGDLQRLTSQAEDKMNSKQYDAAIDMLRKVEAGNPNPNSKMLLGKAFHAQGKVGQAMEYFEKVVEVHPGTEGEAESRLYLARHELDQKNTEKATQHALKVISEHKKSPAYDHALVLLSKISLQAGKKEQAKEMLDLVMKKTESPARSDAEFLIGDLNMEELKSPDAAPEDQVYTLKPRDTLYVLEKRFQVSQDLIMGINNISDPGALRIGQQIRIPKLNISIVIDKVNRTLTLRNGNEFLKKYRVGVNRNDSAIAEGAYTITSKEAKGMDYPNPTGGGTVKKGEPGNPYGKRYLGLKRNIAIHGTDAPEKVGELISVGSISMKNEDIDEVYALVSTKPGTPVTIRGKSSASNDSAAR